MAQSFWIKTLVLRTKRIDLGIDKVRHPGQFRPDNAALFAHLHDASLIDYLAGIF